MKEALKSLKSQISARNPELLELLEGIQSREADYNFKVEEEDSLDVSPASPSRRRSVIVKAPTPTAHSHKTKPPFSELTSLSPQTPTPTPTPTSPTKLKNMRLLAAQAAGLQQNIMPPSPTSIHNPYPNPNPDPTFQNLNVDTNTEVFGKQRTTSNLSPTQKLALHAQSPSHFLESVDSQVENWLALVIKSAGHRVVVPAKLQKTMSKIAETDEGITNTTNIITKLHSSPHSHKFGSTSSSQQELNTVLLDKASLNLLGLPKAVINRIYRAMYVYSVGFHDLIADIHKFSLHGDGIASLVWQTFVHLLEVRVEWSEAGRYTILNPIFSALPPPPPPNAER